MLYNRRKKKVKMSKAKKKIVQDDGSFSDDGDDVFFSGGDLEGCITSDSLPRDGGDEDRSPSTCILSSRSPWLEGEAAVDCGERVAIGGNAIAVDALLTCVPTPIGRG